MKTKNENVDCELKLIKNFRLIKIKCDLGKNIIMNPTEITSIKLPDDLKLSSLVIEKIIYSEDIEDFNSILTKLKTNQVDINQEIRWLMTDNSYHFFNTLFLYEDEAFLTIYLQDITLFKLDQHENISLSQTGINYFECDLNTKKLLLSPATQNAFKLPAVINDFPECLMKRNVIYEADKSIYLSEFSKLINGVTTNTKFDLRVLNDGKYRWNRIFITLVPYKQNYKIIGSILSIEHEVESKINYRIEMDNINRFDSDYVAYILIDLETERIISANSSYLKIEQELHDSSYSDYLRLVKDQFFNDREFEIFSKFITTEHLTFNKDKINKIKYLRLTESGLYICHQSEINYVKDPFSDHDLALIKTYNINKTVVENLLLKEVVQEENELVYRVDNKTKQVITFAKIGNLLKLDSGIAVMKYEEFNRDFLKFQELFEKDNEHFFINDIESTLKELKPNRIYTYITKTKIEPIKYFRTIRQYNGTTEVLTTLMTEITEIVKKEREINDNLEAAVKKSEAATFAKSDFFARMSHDMRTPMGAILGMVDLALDENNNEIIDEYLKQIKDSGEHLLALLNDVLELQKIDQRKLIIDRTLHNYDHFVATSFQMVKIQAQEKGIYLDLHNNLSFNRRNAIFDIIKARQVILNILNNAVKYTPVGGKVSWTLTSFDKEGQDYVRHIVKDNGIGMSSEFQKVMYNEYTRELNNKTRFIEGTGLGLAISKSLMEAVGGTIQCESAPGKGTKFTIEHPIILCDEKEYIKPSKNNFVIASSKTVLIVEDNEINMKIISKLLDKINVNYQTADNGLKAVNLAKEIKFDLIIMDIRMPVLDGIAAAKRIRTFDTKTPIIAISANAYEEDINESLAAGMNTHLSKPIDKEILYSEISKYLNN